MKSALLLVVGLLLGCAPKTIYPHGEGIEGQLEREIMALTAKLTVCEQEREDCANADDRESLDYHLRQIFYESGAFIERDGVIARMILPWDQLFASGLAHADGSRMILDLLATTMTIHEGYTVRITAYPGEAAVPRWLKRRYPTHWDYGIAAVRTLMNVVVTDFEVPESRFILASHGAYGIDAASEEPQHGPRIVLEFIPDGP